MNAKIHRQLAARKRRIQKEYNGDLIYFRRYLEHMDFAEQKSKIALRLTEFGCYLPDCALQNFPAFDLA